MNFLDKYYLLLQFSNKILKKSGTEFQSFFENIMVKAFSDFQKIRPYGNKGDGGNDGYKKNQGIYYQVYAPNEPKINESKASTKFKEDFEKLQKSGWDKISNIKEYYFVFNDKYNGSTQQLEKTISDLEKANPNIKFALFLAKDLEEVFFSLDETSILSLGFNIDSRQAVKNAYTYLDNIKDELDKENAVYAYKILGNVKEIISTIEDDNLSLEYEILECRCLQKLEKTNEAKNKYENIAKRFPNDQRSFLYLSEICLNDKDFDKNLKLLKQAEKINKDCWLLKLEQLLRKYHLREQIILENVDEITFPSDPKIKSKFYRLYALFLEDSGKKIKADSFIEKAIHGNPERLNNYIAKLSILEKRLFSEQQDSERLNKAQELLNEIKEVEDKFLKYGDIGKRNKAALNIIKLNALRILEDIPELEKISKETFELSISCYFDKQIEQIVTTILQFVLLSDNDLNKLLEYIKSSKKKISDELSKALIFQFNLKESLLTDGKKFFKEVNNQKYINFISLIENKNYKQILKILDKDIPFAVTFAATLKNFPKLKRKIIENLSDDENISKEKLLLQLNFDENNFDEAFSILKKLDLSKLSYLECIQILQIVEQKEAWDFDVVILQRLIEKEKDEKQKFNLQLKLFNAHFNLGQYSEAITIGKQLLEKDSSNNYLDIKNKEALLSNTIIACFKRGKIENKFYIEAKKLLEKYQLSELSFEFKAGIEAEVYSYNNDPQNELKAVIEGVKIKKIFSPQEYANLYFLLAIEIGNKIDLNLNSLEKVKENTFVKLKTKDKWYFIGDVDELDAIKITKTSAKYLLFNEKKIGDKIVFKNEYSSEKMEDYIEFVFPIEKYILWQVVKNFQELSKDSDLEGVQAIEISQKGETIDPRNILKFMDDFYKGTEPIFEIYCKNNIPLAVLAVTEDGLTNAIARIQNEQKGFINFSAGTPEEFEKQKELARTILKEKIPFYIDGTSALFLSEIGYLKKIYKYIPNVKVPQSVINLLAEVNGKFTYIEGQVGYMRYVRGKINISTIDKEKKELIRTNFINSIKLLESKPNNIQAISYANKIDCFSEKKVPPELSDACILAQEEKIPVLTEDFLYLKMNELETKKEAPKYFSSLALLRVLYENKKITFEEYIDYFGYLSSYRFRFLSLSSNDIEMAVFGDGNIKIVKPENIRKLNFPLTLSEEYGVPFKGAFNVVVSFLFKMLLDNSVTVEIAERIFIEILESFPTKSSKKELGQMFLEVCKLKNEKNKSSSILFIPDEMFNEKIKRLWQTTEIYTESNLWIPD